MTEDEIWVHHFEPESKRASMKWRHPTAPCSKKLKSQQFAGKVMVTVSWDSVGVILVDFMSKGATINSDVYIYIYIKKAESKQNKNVRIRRLGFKTSTNTILQAKLIQTEFII